eukprot:jgi/Mesen1/4894/ME000244S04085
MTPTSFASSWGPSPARNLSFKRSQYWHLIGSTQAQSLVDLDELTVGEDASVLLLGFGDIRHVLQTAAANDPARRPGGLRKRHLAFHLNDSNDVALARAALLLLVASDCDASSDANLDFLWAVWYHLSLTKEQSARLASCFDRLLASSSLSALGILSVPDAATRARITAVIADWQACRTVVSGPLAAKLREERFQRVASQQYAIERAQGREPLAGTSGHMSSAEEVNAHIAELSWPVSLRVFTDGAGGVSKAHQQAYQREAGRWYRAGMSGQAVASPAAVTAGKGLTANVTLYDLKSQNWIEHFGSCPFYSYLPLPAEYHPQLGTHPIAKQAQAEGPSSCDTRNFLHRCCRDVLRGWVVGFQKWTQAGRVKVTLWGGDALQLCLYTFYPKPVNGPEPEPTPDPPVSESAGLTISEKEDRVEGVHGSKVAGGGCRFDAVETSTLADDVGLLNVLLCCAPLLKQHASTRLVTGSDLWYLAADTVGAYIREGLGFDERLLPSLLGLRFCTDLQFGTSSAPPLNGLSLQEQLPFTAMERFFLTPLTPLGLDLAIAGDPILAADELLAAGGPGGTPCGITEALEYLYCRCFDLEFEDTECKCRVASVTTLTLALLLLRLCPQLSRSMLAHHSPRTPVFPYNIAGMAEEGFESPEPFMQGWRAALFLLARAGIGHPLAWDKWLLATPSRSPTTPPVVLYSRKLEGLLSTAPPSGPQVARQSPLRLFLVVSEDERNLGACLQHLPELLMAQLLGEHHRDVDLYSDVHPLLDSTTVHVIDSFGLTWDDRCLVFPVPASLSLPKRSTIVALAAMEDYGLVGQPALLADCKKLTVPGAALESPTELRGASGKAVSLGDGDSPGVRGSSTSGGASAPKAGTPAPAVTVTALCEHVDRYTGVVSFRPGAQGQVRISGRQLEGEDCYEDAAWSVEIAVGSGSAMLRVAWPVVARRADLQVSRNRGTVCFTIPKSAVWPPQGAKKLSMEALQPWLKGSAGTERLELCTQGMFSLQEMMLSMQHTWPLEEDGHLVLRNCLLVMLEAVWKQEPAFVCFMDQGTRALQPKVSIHVQRVRETAAGFPVLELVFIDHDRMQRLVDDGRVTVRDFFLRYGAILEHRQAVGLAPRLELRAHAEQIQLVLALLWKCSSLVQPSAWQRSHAEQRPEWVASFLPLVYPEDVPPFKGTVPPGIVPRMRPMEWDDQAAEPPGEPAKSADKPPPKKPTGKGKTAGSTPGAASEAGTSRAANGPRGKFAAGQTSGASKAASGSGDAPLVASGKVADAAEGLRREIQDRGKHVKGAPKACDVCGVVDEKVHRCTACKAAAYCSRECQKLAWPSHKELCKQSSGGGRQRSNAT